MVNGVIEWDNLAINGGKRKTRKEPIFFLCLIKTLNELIIVYYYLLITAYCLLSALIINHYQLMLTCTPSGLFSNSNKHVFPNSSQEFLASAKATPFASAIKTFWGLAGSNIRITFLVSAGLLEMNEYLARSAFSSYTRQAEANTCGLFGAAALSILNK